MTAGPRWDDLAPRVASGAAMAVVGALAIWAGGWWFTLLVAAVCGLIVWELARMISPQPAMVPWLLGLGGFGALLLAVPLGGWGLPLLLLPALAGVWLLTRDLYLWAVFATAVPLAGYGLAGLRESAGLIWILWLVAVVVATDIAGYFAGRALGGPKLWPRVSPKKTWSGTAGGWVAAAAVGLVFAAVTAGGAGLVLISVVVSVASQAGDIAESAVKRRFGVKDSSGLIPGHGGVWDRFDALLGAALAVMLLALIADLPAMRF